MNAVALCAADIRELEGDACIEDVRLGERLGMAQPLDIRRSVKRNFEELAGYGPLRTRCEMVELGSGAKREVTVYLLNEEQALLLAMLSRSPLAQALRREIITVFMAYRRGQLGQSAQPARFIPTPATKRGGRGRLSSIEQLPAKCDEDVAWVREALAERRLAQVDILAELNRRLAAKAVKRISKGAFGRFAVRQSLALRRFEESQQVTEEIVTRLGPDGGRAGFVATAEVLRERISNCVTHDEEASPRSLGSAALALQRLRNVTEDNRRGRAAA
ncbi:DUF3486 family protein [Aurantiacibacter xanthus]|uniref:DUF3486 family protein n=1 Tax=Aurantiacibacter xanthus TaxID=1784712 RepID=A0A3A1P1G4_9SPHN|nr:phage protein Gp27 family protein [Aurantiacibacter xanthus]RIV82986.1 DUF3486 family protein [Aurantiacibacter xanthus]